MDEQIQLMIDWIEINIKGSFSLDELSNYMGYSPYYSSFKFHQTTGISIRRYILLRRLYLTTEDLANNRRLIDIAIDYGYSSQEAYSRAFKRVFGITPKDYQINKFPVQSVVKLTMNTNGEWFKMNISKKLKVEKLYHKRHDLLDQDVIHILNGQIMYEEFKNNKLMGESDYTPFNEAMCINATTERVFSTDFIHTRAAGHHEPTARYIEKVIVPLEALFHKEYRCIVLWFGEDMFCQMNLLTILAYLEQLGYKGKVFLNSFREDEFKVNEMELRLGHYHLVYQDVLVHHTKPSNKVIPVMYQAINIYLEMLKEDNEVVKYIKKNNDLPEDELMEKMFNLFSTIGYGDLQYKKLISNVRGDQRA